MLKACFTKPIADPAIITNTVPATAVIKAVLAALSFSGAP